jgi:sulfatase maturation enzyme AslB (radical SAM superfamily)
VTLTSAAIPHLKDSITYFLGKGVPEIGITPIVTHDAGWTNDRIEALDQQFSGVFEACLRHHRRTGEIPLLLFRSNGAAAHDRRPGGAMCRASTGQNLAIDVDGQVHGCAAFIESYQKFPSPFLRKRVAAIRLGDFRAPRFTARLAGYPQAARRTGIFHDKRGKHSSFGRCGECRFVEACSVCPASIGHIPGNTDPSRVPDFICAFNLVALHWREQFPVAPPPSRGVNDTTLDWRARRSGVRPGDLGSRPGG